MKIEIGESLAQSWLKHVKGCQVVQLNWKAQVGEGLHETELAHRILREATSTQEEQPAMFELGKKQGDGQRSITLNQFLQQAEVDAFGVLINNAAAPGEAAVSLYAVDVAFHAAGLGYKDNARVVAKKMVRSALTLLTNFNARAGVMVFASPVVNATEQAKLEDVFVDVQALFERYGLHYNFELLVNERFRSELLQQTMEKSAATTDMNELFLRALKMMQVFDMLRVDITPSITAPTTRKRVARNVATTQAATPDFQAMPLAELWSRVREDPAGDNQYLKIGAALQTVFKRLDLDDNAFAAVSQVLDAGHTLKMSRELTPLRLYQHEHEIEELRKDSAGYNRYYSFTLQRHKQLLLSQWGYVKHYKEWTRIFKAAGLL